MTQYTVSAKINSTIPVSALCYTMQIHHDDGHYRFDALPITDVTAFTEGYQTQQHKTIDLFFEYDRSIFMMSMMFYRKLTNGSLVQLTKKPITTTCNFAEDENSINEIEVDFDYKEYQTRTLATQDNVTNTTLLTVPTPQTIFMAENPGGSQYNPFTQENITKSVLDRIHGKIGLFDSTVFPSIGNTPHLSGAGAFFYCLLKTRPDVYQQTIKGLFEKGRAHLGSLNIQPNNETQKPENYFYTERDFKYGEQLKQVQYLYMPKVPPIDWISLSSLYDALAQEKQDDVWPVVTESQVQEWFEAIGSITLLSYKDIKNLTVDEVCEAHQFIYWQHHLLSLIDSSILTGMSTEPQQLIWVVWVDKLRLTTGVAVSEKTTLLEKVELVLYAQGEVKQRLKENVTLKVFLQNVHRLILFSKIP